MAGFKSHRERVLANVTKARLTGEKTGADPITLLPPKYVEFLHHYSECGYNATQAAKAVKISTGTAVEIVRIPMCQEYIRKLIKEKTLHQEVNPSWVLERLVFVIETCLTPQPVLGRTRKPIPGMYKIKAREAVAALIAVGNYLKMFDLGPASTLNLNSRNLQLNVGISYDPNSSDSIREAFAKTFGEMGFKRLGSDEAVDVQGKKKLN